MYNEIFEAYLQECFGYQLTDLVDTLPFVVNYFAIPMTFELPTVAQNN